MSLKSEITELSSLIPIIKEDRNYWFVRTESGEYYNNFIEGKFIAIGFNEVNFSDIKLAAKNDPFGITLLTERVKNIYKEERRPGYIASQLVRFTYLIKKGDIVIIPSEGSHVLYFGEVTDSIPYHETKIDGCDFKKRKRIKWLKRVNKWQLDAEFYKLFLSRITISDANEYAWFIDKTLNKCYVKGDTAHLVLAVKTDEKIKTNDFYDFGEIFRIANDLLEEENIEEATGFNIRTKVQSQGTIEITNQVILAIILVGIIIVALAGGTFSFKNSSGDSQSETTANLTSDGIIEKIRRALNSKNNRKSKAKIVEEALKHMKIESPEDFVKIIEKFNEKD